MSHFKLCWCLSRQYAGLIRPLFIPLFSLMGFMWLCHGYNALAEHHDKQFKKVFDQYQPETNQHLIVPFIVENQNCGEIGVVLALDPNKSQGKASSLIQVKDSPLIQVEASLLIREMASRLEPKLLRRIKAAVNNEGYLVPDSLERLGLKAIFDVSTLEFYIFIPHDLRRTMIIDLQGKKVPVQNEQTLKQSSMSAFLNLRLGLDYLKQSESSPDRDTLPINLDLEGAINVKNWVLEADAYYRENDPYPWQRGDLRLVHDQPQQMLRYSMGDLSFPVAGFQSFQSLCGFTLAKNFSLQPYRVTGPLSETSFSLKNPARVEIFTNDRHLQTLQLQPGSYNLRDFPLTEGHNNITLKIIDQVGRDETISFPFFFNRKLLAQGEDEFAYSLGWPSLTKNGHRIYEDGFPCFSFFHRLGVNNFLTIGGNLQGNDHQQMGGIEALWVNPYGTLQTELALSKVDGTDVDYAAKLQYYYDHSSNKNHKTRAWSLSLVNMGKSFMPLGRKGTENPVACDMSVRYSQGLPLKMNIGMAGNYQFSRSSFRDTNSLSLFLSKIFGLSTSTNLGINRSTRQTGEVEWRVQLNLSWSWPASPHTYSFNYDTFDQTGRLHWHYTPQHKIGQLFTSAEMQRSTTAYSLSGNMKHSCFRTETSFSYDLITPYQVDQFTDMHTNLRFGSALVWADGSWAISRPVSDSFAIVVPSSNLKGHPVGLNPVGQTYAAQSDAWGPGVIPDLSSYHNHTLSLDVPDLPMWYNPGRASFSLLPCYKSGTVIRVGISTTVMVSGLVQNQDGMPICLQAGEVVSLDDPDQKPFILFTNRQGKFWVDGLKAGCYKLKLFKIPESDFRFDLPEGLDGFYDLGLVRISASIIDPIF